MEQIIQRLEKAANEIDSLGLHKSADRLTNVMKGVLDIKTSQYLGINGYWIRNERCWQNCYRQKRASKPDTPAQEVWQECHSEYLDSFNKNRSDWEKYADEETSLVKFADIHADALDHEDKHFRRLYASKLAQGLNTQSAVMSAIEEGSARYGDILIEHADEISKVAKNIFTKHPKISETLAGISLDLTKEAQIARSRWNPIDMFQRGLGRVQDFVGKGGGTRGYVINRLNNVMNQLQSLRYKFPADRSRLNPDQDERVQEEFNGIMFQIDKELKAFQASAGNDPELQRAIQPLVKAYGKAWSIMNTPVPPQTSPPAGTPDLPTTTLTAQKKYIQEEPGMFGIGTREKAVDVMRDKGGRRLMLDELINATNQALSILGQGRNISPATPARAAKPTPAPTQVATPEAFQPGPEVAPATGSVAPAITADQFLSSLSNLDISDVGRIYYKAMQLLRESKKKGVSSSNNDVNIKVSQLSPTDVIGYLEQLQQTYPRLSKHYNSSFSAINKLLQKQKQLSNFWDVNKKNLSKNKPEMSMEDQLMSDLDQDVTVSPVNPVNPVNTRTPMDGPISNSYEDGNDRMESDPFAVGKQIMTDVKIGKFLHQLKKKGFLQESRNSNR